MLEFTVFMIVKRPSLNESVKDMPDIDNKEVTTTKEIKNIKIVKKYLFITLKLILLSLKETLLRKTCLGFVYDNSSFLVNLNKIKIL